ncbi:hypothetical protein LCGC14_2498770 [marine sediment metagenome]|uniref:Uncharacterized protein n=1 Tax=marine sediment metagenome TaxID=412755 RepID=A0A0F9B377_9ZZZZ
MSVYERVPSELPTSTTSTATANWDFGIGERLVSLSKDEIVQRLQGWMAASLPCVVCGLALEDVFPGDSVNQPSRGLAFMSHGHYGSTVYDPMSDEFLELNICDECLTKASSALRVLRHKRVAYSKPETTHESRFWDAARD